MHVFLLALLLLGSEAHDRGPKAMWNQTNADRLRNDLLTNYDKYARPAEHYDLTVVKLALGQMAYLETDEANSTVSVSATLQLTWRDPKLVWSQENYAGLSSFQVAYHEMWHPDVSLLNSAAFDAVIRYTDPHAVVQANGEVWWSVPAKYTALCEFDLYYWPFDSQSCCLRFGSRSRTAREVKLELTDYKFKDVSPGVVGAWDVVSTGRVVKRYDKCCREPFYQAEIHLSLTRKSDSFLPVVTTPLFVSLTLMQFWLPYGRERVVLSCSTALVVCMLLTYFTQKASVKAVGVPWIVLFYSVSLYLVIIAMVESLTILLLLKSKQKKNLPWIIKKHLQGTFGRVILVEQFTAQQKNESQNETRAEEREGDRDVMVRSPTKSAIEREWGMFANALDRVAFLSFSFVFFVLLLSYAI